MELKTVLESKTVEELKQIARQLKIRGVSNLNKNELIKHIVDNRNEQEIKIFLVVKKPIWKRIKKKIYWYLGILGSIASIVGFFWAIYSPQSSHQQQLTGIQGKTKKEISISASTKKNSGYSKDEIIKWDQKVNENYEIFTNPNKYGVKNSKGKVIINAKYDYLDDWCDGSFFGRMGEWFGAIDINSKVIIPFKYTNIHNFFNNKSLAKVYEGNKEGVIDSDGRIIVELGLHRVSYFYGKIIKVSIGDKYGLMKYKKWIVPPKYDQIASRYGNDADFNEDLTVIKLKNKFGLINSDGLIICDPKYDDIVADYEGAPYFRDGLVAAIKKGKYGFINTRGFIIIPFEYKKVKFFSDGLAPVMKEEKWTYIDRNNRKVFSKLFDYAHEYEDGVAAVLIKNQWYHINKKGNFVKDCPPEGRYFDSEALEILSKRITKDRELDILVRNVTNNDIVIKKIGIKILKDYGIAACPALSPSAKYTLDLGMIGEHNTKYLDVSFLVNRHSADRFLINLATTCFYDFRVTLYFNKSEMTSFEI